MISRHKRLVTTGRRSGPHFFRSLNLMIRNSLWAQALALPPRLEGCLSPQAVIPGPPETLRSGALDKQSILHDRVDMFALAIKKREIIQRVLLHHDQIRVRAF